MAMTAASFFLLSFAIKYAALLCVLAALLDAIDGWYARTFSQCSNLGKRLDPIADRSLVFTRDDRSARADRAGDRHPVAIP